MERVIRSRRIVSDFWQWVKETAVVPATGDFIVPLALWRAERTRLPAREGRTAVWLDVNEGPELVAADLHRLPLVAVHFPTLGDGRGFSTARLLRERYGYAGELRAVGEVVRDQLLFMSRCGFDAFALRADQDVEAALAAFHELPVTYHARAA